MDKEAQEKQIKKTFNDLLKDNNMFATWLERNRGMEIAFNWRFRGNPTPTLTDEEGKDYQLLCYQMAKGFCDGTLKVDN